MLKKLFTLIVLTGTTLATLAQNVNIPDANFKTYLVGNTAINTNSDTEIQVSEAQAFTGTINCSNMAISDLTGIEAFTSITNLNCTDNQLTTIDVSNNTSLTHLSVFNNSLTSLDVSNIMSLTNLWCMFNPITSLDLHQNGNLVFLQANNCSLTYLNLSNGNNTNFIGAKTNNNNLTCIEVDDASFSASNWTSNDFSKDATATYSENCASTVGMETTNQTSINLFPNPINSILNIETTKNEMVYFLNILGEIVHQEQLVSGVNTISVNDLENGIYFIQTQNGTTQKFVKQ